MGASVLERCDRGADVRPTHRAHAQDEWATAIIHSAVEARGKIHFVRRSDSEGGFLDHVDDAFTFTKGVLMRPRLPSAVRLRGALFFNLLIQ